MTKRSRFSGINRGTLFAGVLLLGMFGDRLSMPKPADAAAYHGATSAAAGALPLRIADWVGKETKVPPAAVALLRPNVMLSRRYLNTSTGLELNLLLVQCGDARDMLAHYPPVCYPSRGWVLSAGQPREWALRDLIVKGMEYRFAMNTLGRDQSLVVYNFMVMPDGRFLPDMAAIEAAAADVNARYFGAAQFQFVFAGDQDAGARDRALSELLEGMWPTLTAIRSGRVR
jgi:hypothetical protein